MYTFEGSTTFYTSIEEAQKASEIFIEEYKKSEFEEMVSQCFKLNDLNEIEFKPNVEIKKYVEYVNKIAEIKAPNIYQVTPIVL